MCSLFGCRHKFTAFVDEDGYQYCIKCGKAEFVSKGCIHKWVQGRGFSISEVTTDVVIAHQQLYHCEKCGELKVEMIDNERDDR